METFESRLARLEVVTRIPAVREVMPEGLGEWACARLRELAEIRAQRDLVPDQLAKRLRNQRILAAAELVDAERPTAIARELWQSGQLVDRTWGALGSYDLGADTVRAHLHAANDWYRLPCARTYVRIMTNRP